MTAKKVWGIGDRAYVLWGSRVLAVTIDRIGTVGHVHAKHGRYEGLWVHTRRLRTDRRALDVTALERQLREADKAVEAANAAQEKARQAYVREVERRGVVKKRLAAAKAKVAK